MSFVNGIRLLNTIIVQNALNMGMILNQQQLWIFVKRQRI